jgi:hypothetical protein
VELKRSRLLPLRALITECLPYEIPLEIADHWLYDWLEARTVSLSERALKLRTESRFDLLVLALIGDADFNRPAHVSGQNYARISSFDRRWRAPATFRVRRDRSRTRDLDLVSFRSQLNIAFLYYNFKDTLLHFVNRDRTSLRHPSRANSHGKHLANKLRAGRNSNVVSVETSSRQLGTYNSYFVYNKYAFVGQFYDSREWHALEARWQFLRRLDVSNCFRSIYTHAASWSTGTDFFSKEHLSSGVGRDLGDALDRTMQSANWGETHGICIGPEASRIFAEIVFQHLGIEMQSRIRETDIDTRQYEILRYVDDYFVFASDPAVLSAVSSIIETTLIEHKFSLNAMKTRDSTTPFTSEISLKKANLKSYLKIALPFEGDLQQPDDREVSVHLKSTLIGAEDESAAVGASLSQIERRLSKFLQKRASKCRSGDEQLLLDYVWTFVHNMLFQYLSHPSVASAMKVVRVLRMYFGASALFSISEGKKKRLQFLAEENVHFAIHKAVQRLSEVESAEIEICHFLSLAGACKIQIEPTSRLADALVSQCIQKPVPRPKGNHASILLTLSVMKHLLADSRGRTAVGDELIGQCERIAAEILGSGYIPDPVKRHAIQEIFVLSIATCPFIDAEQKFSILNRPWLITVIAKELFGNDEAMKAARRFLRCCLADGERVVGDSLQSTEIFAWRSDTFDALLYEKQPQFIY